VGSGVFQRIIPAVHIEIQLLRINQTMHLDVQRVGLYEASSSPAVEPRAHVVEPGFPESRSLPMNLQIRQLH
jgi:hypothetical protein